MKSSTSHSENEQKEKQNKEKRKSIAVVAAAFEITALIIGLKLDQQRGGGGRGRVSSSVCWRVQSLSTKCDVAAGTSDLRGDKHWPQQTTRRRGEPDELFLVKRARNCRLPLDGGCRPRRRRLCRPSARRNAGSPRRLVTWRADKFRWFLARCGVVFVFLRGCWMLLSARPTITGRCPALASLFVVVVVVVASVDIEIPTKRIKVCFGGHTKAGLA